MQKLFSVIDLSSHTALWCQQSGLRIPSKQSHTRRQYAKYISTSHVLHSHKANRLSSNLYNNKTLGTNKTLTAYANAVHGRLLHTLLDTTQRLTQKSSRCVIRSSSRTSSSMLYTILTGLISALPVHWRILSFSLCKSLLLSHLWYTTLVSSVPLALIHVYRTKFESHTRTPAHKPPVIPNILRQHTLTMHKLHVWARFSFAICVSTSHTSARLLLWHWVYRFWQQNECVKWRNSET